MRADDEVVVPGRQVDGPRVERAPVGGLDHPQRAEPVQPLGELTGEDGGHVLHEEHRHREGGREHREDPGQRLGAAGGGTDDEDCGLLAGAGARRGRADRGDRDDRDGHAGRAGGGRAAGERLDLGDQLLADALHRLTDAADVGRLRHVLVGAGGQRVEGRGRPPFGERAEHDDRDAAACGPDRADRLDAVHLRHLDVHRDQVGLELLQLRHGDLAVDGGTHDLDVGVCGQHVGHDLADDDGIVDDHHPDRVHACPPASLSGQPDRRFISCIGTGSRGLERAPDADRRPARDELAFPESFGCGPSEMKLRHGFVT
jgi:hypothetical protein